jgi:hypothetical protein
MLDDNEKQTCLMLFIYQLDEELHQTGKKMAEDIARYNANDVPEFPKETQICWTIEHFYDTFEHILSKILFLENVMKLFGLKSDTNLGKRMSKFSKDEACIWYAGSNFNWPERRFYTEKEQKERNEKANAIAMEIIGKMRKRGEI